MTEMYIIYPACCITGKHCSYNNGFIDGYMIGMATILLVTTIISCISVWYEVCKGKPTVEDEEGVDHVEETNETSEVEEQDEKSDEDKKDD